MHKKITEMACDRWYFTPKRNHFQNFCIEGPAIYVSPSKKLDKSIEIKNKKQTIMSSIYFSTPIL